MTRKQNNHSPFVKTATKTLRGVSQDCNLRDLDRTRTGNPLLERQSAETITADSRPYAVIFEDYPPVLDNSTIHHAKVDVKFGELPLLSAPSYSNLPTRRVWNVVPNSGREHLTPRAASPQL